VSNNRLHFGKALEHLSTHHHPFSLATFCPQKGFQMPTDTPTYAVVLFWTIQQKSNFVQIRTEYTYGELYMYNQRSLAEIRTPSPWNLISHSTATLLPVLSPSSIFPPPFPHCTFIPTVKNLV
jgi:hypothetical protein